MIHPLVMTNIADIAIENGPFIVIFAIKLKMCVFHTYVTYVSLPEGKDILTMCLNWICCRLVLCLAVILRDNGTGGISFKTHILYFIVFTARFSNVFFCLKLSWNSGNLQQQKTKQREFPDMIPVYHSFGLYIVHQNLKMELLR